MYMSRYMFEKHDQTHARVLAFSPRGEICIPALLPLSMSSGLSSSEVHGALEVFGVELREAVLPLSVLLFHRRRDPVET